MSLRKTLDQDDLDWYNSTFAFILLLLLGLFSLLLPLTSKLNFNVHGQLESQRRPKEPKVSLRCWAPAQFSDWSHVLYTNTHCNEAMVRKLRGKDEVHAIYATSELEEFLRGINPTFKGDKSTSSEISSARSSGVERKQQRLMEIEKAQKNLRGLVFYQAPLVFLLLAFVFEAVYILCSLIRDALPSCVNVDQILDTCVVSRSLKLANQTQILEETAEEVAESVKRSRNTASTVYMLNKVLHTVIVIVAMCYIGGVVLVDINQMKQNLAEEKLSGGIHAKQNLSSQSEFRPLPDGSSTRTTSKHTSEAFHCFFRIRQKNNNHDYTVQCAMNQWAEEDNSHRDVGTDKDVKAEVTMADPNTQNTLLLYQTLFSVALASLVVSLVANVFSTISWILRLFVKSNATSVGLPSNAARDVVLLVHMARLNAGPTVARSLAGSPVWSKSVEETDREPILEIDTNED